MEEKEDLLENLLLPLDLIDIEHRLYRWYIRGDHWSSLLLITEDPILVPEKGEKSHRLLISGKNPWGKVARPLLLGDDPLSDKLRKLIIPQPSSPKETGELPQFFSSASLFLS